VADNWALRGYAVGLYQLGRLQKNVNLAPFRYWMELFQCHA
jgi:hypothetical protein